jgi:hypothetical protein
VGAVTTTVYLFTLSLVFDTHHSLGLNGDLVSKVTILYRERSQADGRGRGL